MSYTVKLTDMLTQETRTVEMDGEWDLGAEFMWNDGNFACDCNRAKYFGLEVDCSNSRFEAELPPETEEMLNEYAGLK